MGAARPLACYASVMCRMEEAKERLRHALNLDKNFRKLALDDVNEFVLQVELVNRRSYLIAAASLAHCQNFSAAKLSFSFRAAMQRAIGFGSGVRRKSFTRFPKL